MHKKPAAVFSLKISQSQPLQIFCMYDSYLSYKQGGMNNTLIITFTENKYK